MITEERIQELTRYYSYRHHLHADPDSVVDLYICIEKVIRQALREERELSEGKDIDIYLEAAWKIYVEDVVNIARDNPGEDEVEYYGIDEWIKQVKINQGETQC